MINCIHSKDLKQLIGEYSSPEIKVVNPNSSFMLAYDKEGDINKRSSKDFQPPINNSIISGAKIYISSESQFPSLYISRNKSLDIKRVSKIDKADFVVGETYLPIYVDGKNRIVCIDGEPKYFYLSSGYRSINKSQPDVIKFIQGLETGDITIIYGCYIFPRQFEELEFIINNPDKFITDSTLARYYQEFLEPMPPNWEEGLLPYFKSKDIATVKLGIALLVGYNFKDRFYDVYKILKSLYHPLKHMPKNFSDLNYLKILFGIKAWDQLNTYELIKDLKDLYYNALTDNDRNEIEALLIAQIDHEISNKYHTYFDMWGYNVKITK